MDKQASHDEFLRLFSQNSNRIFEFISTLVFSPADADDIFQNTCVVLWKKFDTYDPEGSFRAWACKIAYYEMLQLRRCLGSCSEGNEVFVEVVFLSL